MIKQHLLEVRVVIWQITLAAVMPWGILRQVAIRSIFDEFCDVGPINWNLCALEALGVVRPRPFGVRS